MSDSPRLSELRRQRALVHEHLAWLDKEIAAEPGARAAELAPVESRDPQDKADAAVARDAAQSDAGLRRTDPEPSERGLTQPVPVAIATVQTDVDSILSDYHTPASKLQQDVRLGCFLYFAAALLVVAAGVTVLYFLLRHS